MFTLWLSHCFLPGKQSAGALDCLLTWALNAAEGAGRGWAGAGPGLGAMGVADKFTLRGMLLSPSSPRRAEVDVGGLGRFYCEEQIAISHPRRGQSEPRPTRVPCTAGATELRIWKDSLTFAQTPEMYCCCPHM